ncbi:MAG: insulinase family protein [Pirellulales bacterium]|nr:insulinase family protein [Pirellulales bacterium]
MPLCHARETPVNETIHSHIFPNGLVLVAEPMPALQSAAFTFLVPAGCAYDPTDRGGLSGFACELVLRGAGPRDSRQLVLDLDRLGVERSESIHDAHTGFGGVMLAEHLADALAIYADVLRRPHLPAEHLEAVRHVMVQEYQAVEDEPAQKVMIELRRRFYPNPWGRPCQGDLAAIHATSLDDIKSFYKRNYHAGGTILGVAGRFEWNDLVDTVGELFGDWPAGANGLADHAPCRIARDHLDYDSQQTQIGIAYPSVPYRDDRYFEAWGAVGVLSGGMSARLFTEVRERRGLCYSIYAVCHSLRHVGGVFCYAGTSAERAQETLDVTLGELTRLARGVEPSELDRLKARIKSALIMQQESSSARGTNIARDWHHLGRARSLDEVSRRIDALSCQSINGYLAANPPGDFTVVTLGPRPLEVPQ